MPVIAKSLATLGMFSLLLQLSACGILRDEPTSKAVGIIETYATMPDAEYREHRNAIAFRERLAFDYLRALQEQNSKLSYGVENVQRQSPGSRKVIVTVSDRSATNIDTERAKFEVIVERDDQKAWRVASYQLVE
jgi:hypothetical protein